MKKLQYIYIIVIALIFSNSWGQVGIGIENPEADLDVNLNTKLSGLKDVTHELLEYNKIVFADKDGNIGYQNRNVDSYIYRNTYFAKMTNVSSISTKLTSLGLDISIAVPANGQSMVEINYSVSIINGSGSNASLVLSRVENGTETFLYEATRSFTFADGYSNSATAKGRAISNVHYDEIKNDSNTIKNVTYKLYGIVTINTALIGMWSHISSGAQANFNWGRGSINVNIFDY